MVNHRLQQRARGLLDMGPGLGQRGEKKNNRLLGLLFERAFFFLPLCLSFFRFVFSLSKREKEKKGLVTRPLIFFQTLEQTPPIQSDDVFCPCLGYRRIISLGEEKGSARGLFFLVVNPSSIHLEGGTTTPLSGSLLIQVPTQLQH